MNVRGEVSRMRQLLWLMLPLFVGCSAEHIVAGTENTKAENLASSLPVWCTSACKQMQSCDTDCACTAAQCDCNAVPDDCATSCQQELLQWTSGGDACAAVGERLKDCVDDAGCRLFGDNRLDCSATPAERERCGVPGGDAKGGDDDPPDVSGETGGAGPIPPGGEGGIPAVGGGQGGTTSVGGTTSIGGSEAASGGVGEAGTPSEGGSTHGGSTSTGGTGEAGVGGVGEAGSPSEVEPVTCTEGSMSGTGGGASGTFQCQGEFSACSDNHNYDYFCVTSTGNCYCFVDRQPVAGFSFTKSCPTPVELDQACGWNLSD